MGKERKGKLKKRKRKEVKETEENTAKKERNCKGKDEIQWKREQRKKIRRTGQKIK